MRKIKIYGADNTEAESNVPTNNSPAQQARYRNFKILTVTAFVMLVVLLVECMVLVGVKLLFIDDIVTKAFCFGIEIVTLSICIGLFFFYKYLYHSLSYTNLIIIITAEVIMAISQVIMCIFTVPVLFIILLVLGSLFILYCLITLNCGLKYKVIMSLITVFVLLVTNFVYVKNFEFTPKYFYISNTGYTNKVNDEYNFYYSGALNKIIDEDYDEFDEIVLLTATMANTMVAVHSIEELKAVGENFHNSNLPFADMVNHNNIYNDEFFKNNCLYFSVMELENKHDTITCNEIQYSLKYSRPVINYHKSGLSNEDDSEKAICVMVFEVPLQVKQDIFADIGGFTTDKALVFYN